MSPPDSVYEEATQALVRAYIACRLAVEALPDLPAEIRSAVAEPVESLCDVVGPALERLRPGFLDHDAFGRRG